MAVDEVTASIVLNRVAETYVELVLGLGVHDEDYVDAYYGSPELRTRAESQGTDINQLRRRAVQALTQLHREPAPSSDQMLRLRYEFLVGQLTALVTRIDFLRGTRLPFDRESELLYGAIAPTNDVETFENAQRELDDLLPGSGSLESRLEAFRSGYVIAPERLDAVFSRALQACRERTAQYVDLPQSESFTIEYVRDKPWSGYNWYQGNYQSIIQVNIDLAILIDRALDLACHEGYPGHHVYNTLLEQQLTRARGWMEFSVYPLFSPQSLIAEGSANYGIEVVFPGSERLAFERDTLYELAGLDPGTADVYARVTELLAKLDYAGNEAAREYLDGRIDRDGAAGFLARYNLMSAERAEQRVAFFDKYRSYVINYNLGEDLVRDYVEHGIDASNAAQRWERFVDLLSSPRIAGTLTR